MYYEPIYTYKEFFYWLFGCPMAHFGPMLREQYHQPYINHCVSDTNFDSKATKSIVIRMGPKAQMSNKWDLNWEPSNFE